jgi:hyperosmotically inducible protein
MRRTRLFSLLVLVLTLSTACRTNESPEGQVKDAGITTTVKTRLAEDLNTATLGNISVNATNGVVTLSGQVASADQKQRAEDIVKSVDGVTRVNNNLQIQTAP